MENQIRYGNSKTVSSRPASISEPYPERSVTVLGGGVLNLGTIELFPLLPQSLTVSPPVVASRVPTRKPVKKKAPVKERFEALCAHYGNVCLCCGKKKRLTIDHVIPKSKGGRNDVSNWQPLCQRCNSKKGVDSTDYRPKTGEASG